MPIGVGLIILAVTLFLAHNIFYERMLSDLNKNLEIPISSINPRMKIFKIISIYRKTYPTGSIPKLVIWSGLVGAVSFVLGGALIFNYIYMYTRR
jgi:hypothetical protein